MPPLSNTVLLEGAVNSVARQGGLYAQRLISLLAEVARQTRAVEPFDPHSLANLANIVIDELASSDHYTGTLMATNQW